MCTLQTLVDLMRAEQEKQIFVFYTLRGRPGISSARAIQEEVEQCIHYTYGCNNECRHCKITAVDSESVYSQNNNLSKPPSFIFVSFKLRLCWSIPVNIFPSVTYFIY